MHAQWVEKAIHRRYATKMFDPCKKISVDLWHVLENTLLLSPSGYGLQPWKFLVVQDSKIRQRLTAASLNQAQVEDCSHFVVFASKTSVDEKYIESHIDVVARARKLPKETFASYYQMMIDDVIKGPKSKYVSEWTARQAYIALGALLIAAAILDIYSCPLEGILPERYDEILGLAGSGYRTLAACALGYRTADDKYASFAKARFDKSQIMKYV